MDGNATGSTGVVADDGGRATDHPPGHWSGTLDRVSDLLTQAAEALHYSNTQEAGVAYNLIDSAQELLNSLVEEEEPTGEGERGG